MAESDVHFIDGKEIRIEREGGTLVAELTGRGRLRVAELLKCFPLTDPERYISLRDENGQELGILREIASLDEKSRMIVQEELAKRYFMPIIRRVTSVKETGGAIEIEAVTDKGNRTIQLAGRGEAINEIQPGRIILTDVSGNLYEISDYTSMDIRSVRLLNQIL